MFRYDSLHNCKTKHKKWFIPMLVVLLLLGMRVIYINKKYHKDVVYLDMNTRIDFGDFSLVPLEAMLLSVDEFEDYFGFDINEDTNMGINKNDKIICIRFHAENTSDKELPWSDVLSDKGEGFESLTWCSVGIPEIERIINVVYADSFHPGNEIDFWRVTVVSRSIFRESAWRELSVDDFMFTLSFEPEIVKIRMK